MLTPDLLMAFPPEGLPVAKNAFFGQAVLITGCAPGSIPLGVAKVFAAASGARLLLAHVDRPEDIRSVRGELDAVVGTGTEIDVMAANFCDDGQLDVLTSWALKRSGVPDVVVHGAGLTAYSAIADPNPVAAGAVQKIKADALRRLGRAFLPGMKARCSGVWACFGSIQSEYTCGDEPSDDPAEFLGNFDYQVANLSVETWCTMVTRTYGPSGISTFCYRPSLTINARHLRDPKAVRIMEAHELIVPSRMVPGPIDHGIALYSLAIPCVAKLFNGGTHDPWCGEGQRLPQK